MKKLSALFALTLALATASAFAEVTPVETSSPRQTLRVAGKQHAKHHRKHRHKKKHG
jgi:hypothetical protein